MGFFDDVQAEISADGVLTYGEGKPYVREVKIEGNSQIGRDKIETALGVTPRTILDQGEWQRVLTRLESFITSKVRQR
jgi:outer membrane protein assembly factor BamA